MFFSSLSFYRIPRLKMWQIQKAAPQDIFHRSRKFFVQISMSLILTRSLYQEHLRNVGSLTLSIIDVHNEKIHCFTWWYIALNEIKHVIYASSTIAFKVTVVNTFSLERGTKKKILTFHSAERGQERSVFCKKQQCQKRWVREFIITIIFLNNWW